MFFKQKRNLLFISLLLLLLAFTGYFYFQTSNYSSNSAASGPKKEHPELKTHNKITYTFENKKMYVTFNHGTNWQKVPASIHAIFGGDYE